MFRFDGTNMKLNRARQKFYFDSLRANDHKNLIMKTEWDTKICRRKNIFFSYENSGYSKVLFDSLGFFY